MRSGLRPIHSVEMMTWTSEISGTASSGVFVIAQMPHTVTITVPVNTRNRLDAHQSMIRSIMRNAPRRSTPLRSLGGESELLLPDLFSLFLDADGDVPGARHHHVRHAHVHAGARGLQLHVIP